MTNHDESEKRKLLIRRISENDAESLCNTHEKLFNYHWGMKSAKSKTKLYN